MSNVNKVNAKLPQLIMHNIETKERPTTYDDAEKSDKHEAFIAF